MEGTEQNQQEDIHFGANAAIEGAENNQGEQQNEGGENTALSWQEQAIKFAKENGVDINDINDLLKPVEKIVEKEVIKEVNPYDEILDDDTKAFIEFRKNNPALGRAEYDATKKDWDAISNLDAARERVRKESGMNLSDEKADAYIMAELGIADMDDLDAREEINLAKFSKPYKDEKKAEQEKYKTQAPAQENKTEPAKSENDELVKLPNGAVMRKEDLEKEQETIRKHVEAGLEAVKTVKGAEFSLSLDDNGTVQHIPIPYEYTEKDVQNMASIVSNTQEVINKRYRSENGFNHAGFAEDMLWSDPEFRKKAIADIAQKIDAQATERVMKQRGNHSFTNPQSLHKQTREGVDVRPATEVFKFR